MLYNMFRIMSVYIVNHHKQIVNQSKLLLNDFCNKSKYEW